MKKRIGIFGCKSTTVFLLSSLKENFDISFVVTISPELGDLNQVADYTNLVDFCNEYTIPVYQAHRYDLKSEIDKEKITEANLDIAFVIGWQRLIPNEILTTFSVGVFGMHGSTDDLPLGRGRSPMNWALIEQRKLFFTNIFKYDAGVDSGDILDTFVFSIQVNDTSETMHYKNVLAMKMLIIKNIKKLIDGSFKLSHQKANQPTYYPKRTPEDSIIDWQSDIYQLDAFVRAVTKPFNGAFSYVNAEKITIWRASIFETSLVDYGCRDLAWGKVVEVFPGGKFLVNCRGGLLIVHEYESKMMIEKNNLLESIDCKIFRFKLNSYGCHDLK